MIKSNIKMTDDGILLKMDNFSETLDMRKKNTMRLIMFFLQRMVKGKTPVGVTSSLRSGISITTKQTKKSLTGKLATNAVTSTYAAAVESGTKPHFPPLEPIMLWVRRVLGIDDEKENKKVAFLVARKISRVGTDGQFMFRDGLKESKVFINQKLTELNRQIEKDLK